MTPFVAFVVPALGTPQDLFATRFERHYASPSQGYDSRSSFGFKRQDSGFIRKDITHGHSRDNNIFNCFHTTEYSKTNLLRQLEERRREKNHFITESSEYTRPQMP